jgi:hypothetical protein
MVPKVLRRSGGKKYYNYTSPFTKLNNQSFKKYKSLSRTSLFHPYSLSPLTHEYPPFRNPNLDKINSDALPAFKKLLTGLKDKKSAYARSMKRMDRFRDIRKTYSNRDFLKGVGKFYMTRPFAIAYARYRYNLSLNSTKSYSYTSKGGKFLPNQTKFYTSHPKHVRFNLKERSPWKSSPESMDPLTLVKKHLRRMEAYKKQVAYENGDYYKAPYVWTPWKNWNLGVRMQAMKYSLIPKKKRLMPLLTGLSNVEPYFLRKPISTHGSTMVLDIGMAQSPINTILSSRPLRKSLLVSHKVPNDGNNSPSPLSFQPYSIPFYPPKRVTDPRITGDLSFDRLMTYPYVRRGFSFKYLWGINSHDEKNMLKKRKRKLNRFKGNLKDNKWLPIFYNTEYKAKKGFTPYGDVPRPSYTHLPVNLYFRFLLSYPDVSRYHYAPDWSPRFDSTYSLPSQVPTMGGKFSTHHIPEFHWRNHAPTRLSERRDNHEFLRGSKANTYERSNNNRHGFKSVFHLSASSEPSHKDGFNLPKYNVDFSYLPMKLLPKGYTPSYDPKFNNYIQLQSMEPTYVDPFLKDPKHSVPHSKVSMHPRWLVKPSFDLPTESNYQPDFIEGDSLVLSSIRTEPPRKSSPIYKKNGKWLSKKNTLASDNLIRIKPLRIPLSVYSRKYPGFKRKGKVVFTKRAKLGRDRNYKTTRMHRLMQLYDNSKMVYLNRRPFTKHMVKSGKRECFPHTPVDSESKSHFLQEKVKTKWRRHDGTSWPNKNNTLGFSPSQKIYLKREGSFFIPYSSKLAFDKYWTTSKVRSKVPPVLQKDRWGKPRIKSRRTRFNMVSRKHPVSIRGEVGYLKKKKMYGKVTQRSQVYKLKRRRIPKGFSLRMRRKGIGNISRTIKERFIHKFDLSFLSKRDMNSKVADISSYDIHINPNLPLKKLPYSIPKVFFTSKLSTVSKDPVIQDPTLTSLTLSYEDSNLPSDVHRTLYETDDFGGGYLSKIKNTSISTSKLSNSPVLPNNLSVDGMHNRTNPNDTFADEYLNSLLSREEWHDINPLVDNRSPKTINSHETPTWGDAFSPTRPVHSPSRVGSFHSGPYMGKFNRVNYGTHFYKANDYFAIKKRWKLEVEDFRDYAVEMRKSPRKANLASQDYFDNRCEDYLPNRDYESWIESIKYNWVTMASLDITTISYISIPTEEHLSLAYTVLSPYSRKVRRMVGHLETLSVCMNSLMALKPILTPTSPSITTMYTSYIHNSPLSREDILAIPGILHTVSDDGFKSYLVISLHSSLPSTREVLESPLSKDPCPLLLLKCKHIGGSLGECLYNYHVGSILSNQSSP